MDNAIKTFFGIVIAMILWQGVEAIKDIRDHYVQVVNVETLPPLPEAIELEEE